MSHSQPIFSPAGTPILDRTVGELVAEHPALSRVFQFYRMDFCCQGNLTVKQACVRKNVDSAEVKAALEAAMQIPEETAENPAQLPLPELVKYIITRHHDYLRCELPRLYTMSQRVARVHGEHTPSLVEVFQVFSDLTEHLMEHTEEEERTLFPRIIAQNAGASVDALGDDLSKLMLEHEVAGAALESLRELTNDFTPPEHACNTYRALFAGLAELQQDMHRHIHLENSVLFPAALAKAN